MHGVRSKDLLGDPDAIVVHVQGVLGGESVDAAVRIPVACCGNGDVDPSESCDDANEDDTDDCLSTCEAASCGDGAVHAGVEDCDDANGEDTDACTNACQDARCGDGIVWAGQEQCDDGNDASGDGDDGGSGEDDAGVVADGGTGGGDDGTGDDAGASDSGGCRTGGEQPTTLAALLLGLVLLRARRGTVARVGTARAREARPRH